MNYSDRLTCSVITAAEAAWQGRGSGGGVLGVGLPHSAAPAVLPWGSAAAVDGAGLA